MTLDQTLASALAPLRKIAQVFTLPSGVWFTSIATLATKQKLFFSLLNARTVGCRPVTLLAYSLSFCTNCWTHTHTHTHTCTHTCIYHRQNWLHGPHSVGEPAGSNKTGGPVGSGDNSLISTSAWLPQCIEVLIYGLARPMRCGRWSTALSDGI